MSVQETLDYAFEQLVAEIREKIQHHPYLRNHVALQAVMEKIDYRPKEYVEMLHRGVKRYCNDHGD